jgi:arylsulfatase
VDWPILVNLRLDPFERTGMYNGKDGGSISYYNWFVYQFWRFQGGGRDESDNPRYTR